MKGARESAFASHQSPTTKVIGVRTDTGTEYHVPNVSPGDYDTLCGIDADDPDIGHHGTVKAKPGQQVTCSQCCQIFFAFQALDLKASDFKGRP